MKAISMVVVMSSISLGYDMNWGYGWECNNDKPFFG